MIGGRCSVTEDIGIRWCKQDSEDHWGIGVYCMIAPDGAIFIVHQPFGTDLVDAPGWTLVPSDAGAGESNCSSALQSDASCEY